MRLCAALVLLLLAAQQGRATLPARCPFVGLDAIEVTNRAAEELVRAGRLEEALACNEHTLWEHSQGTVQPPLTANVLDVVQGNAALLRRVLGPYGGPAVRRLIHGLGADHKFPHSDEPLVSGKPDQSVQVFDGAFSAQQCASVVELFERSPLFQGNLISNGKVHVDTSHKNVWEFDISGTQNNSEWAGVERLAVSAMVKHLALYEEANPIMRTLRNPLGDEGFRMKRYRAGEEEHHAYHADSGQEALGQYHRVLAVLMYLSEPEEGGETVFYNQGLAVRPKCGRVLIFPCAQTHVHAGRRVKKGVKYAISLMITA
jgi:2OG-Fe(II) oxygenase superfamily